MSNGILVGLDEAGRGCCIGSLVLAAVCAPEVTIERWKKHGITDSKQLSPKKRAMLWEVIMSDNAEGLAEVCHGIVEAKDLDDLRRNGHTLNTIEMQLTADLLKAVVYHASNTEWYPKNYPVSVFIDAQSSQTQADALRLREKLDGEQAKLFGKIRFEVKGDARFTVVGAASIVAKQVRDGMVLEKHGCSGYPEPKTMKHVASCLLNNNQEMITDFRMTWAPVVRMVKQTKYKGEVQ